VETDLVMLLLSSALLTISSITDFRRKEVPDFLTNTFILFGILSQLTIFLSTWNWSRLIWVTISSTFSIAVGMLLYFSGIWGGGDVKVLAACALLFGYVGEDELFFLKFFSNFLLVGALYGSVFFLLVFLRNFSKISKERKIANFTLIILIFLSSLLFSDFWYMIVMTGFLIWLSLNADWVENSMKKYVEIPKLTEGDWLVRPVRYGRIVVEPRATGLTREDLRKLKKLYRMGRVKKVLIKEGVPFVPAFLVAFILTLIFRDFLVLKLVTSSLVVSP